MKLHNSLWMGDSDFWRHWVREDNVKWHTEFFRATGDITPEALLPYLELFSLSETHQNDRANLYEVAKRLCRIMRGRQRGGAQ